MLDKTKRLKILLEDQSLETSDIARLLGLSPTAFVKSFVEATGEVPELWRTKNGYKKPSDWLKKAKELLANPTLHTQDVAKEFGVSVSSFSRSFKSQTTLSPKEWRYLYGVKKLAPQPEWMPRARELLRDLKKHNLDYVAAEVGLSLSAFLRAFKKATGVTPKDWKEVKQVKHKKKRPFWLSKINKMLRDPSLSIQEIAKARKQSPGDFTESYKNATGLTPSQWRLKHKIVFTPEKRLPEWFAEAVNSLIECPEKPIEDIAAQFSISPKNFGKAFKRATGLSPRNYREKNIPQEILARKAVFVPEWLPRAESLVAESCQTGMQMQEIASQLGVTRHHLTKVFRDVHGCSLRTWRKERMHQMISFQKEACP
jgi:AraC-like DNA-binding protein